MNPRPLLFSVVVSFGFQLLAQAPEPIYGFAKVRKSLDYYKTQNQLWKTETEKNPQNALAWYYRYKCSRNLLKLDSTDRRPRKERIQEQENLVQEMGKNVPESFEYNLVMWANAGLDKKKIAYLNNAVAKGGQRTEHLEFVLIQAELERNIAKRDATAQQMLAAQDYSPGFLYYCYNLIIGLKPNSIIFTAGDNDTYGIWYLQSKGIRKDVIAINTSLASIKEYRDLICKELKIPIWPNDHNDPSIGTDSAQACLNLYTKGIIEHFALQLKNTITYVSITVETDYSDPISDKLYLVGLAYEYSNTGIDNMAILHRNFEQLYMLNYLTQPLYYDRSLEIVQDVNTNYIVPMYKLWKHYISGEQYDKANQLKPMLLTLLKSSSGNGEILKEIEQTKN